jgi:acyl-CoA thioesterase
MELGGGPLVPFHAVPVTYPLMPVPAGPPEPHPFDVDTAVAPAGAGLFSGLVTDRWTTPGGTPNGGYLLAICARALGEVMAFPDPLAISGYFLRPASVGQPADLATAILRSGRNHSTGTVALRQAGKNVVSAVGTFTAHQGHRRTVVDGSCPGLPPAEELPDVLEGISLPGVTIADRVEFRMPNRPGWLDGAPSGRAYMEYWARLRGGREPDLWALAFLVDAAPPVVMELGEFASSTVELTVHLRASPAPGWLAFRASTRFMLGGYYEEDIEVWDSAGRLVAQSRQLAILL